MWLNCFQSHAQRWQSISLDLCARDPLAEERSQCSSVTQRALKALGWLPTTSLGASGQDEGGFGCSLWW